VSFSRLKSYFTDFTFYHLQQIHSAQVIPAQHSNTGAPHGDGHFTHSSGKALCIVTADCLPIFLISPREGLWALHAGWRGLRSGIILKTLAEISTFHHLFCYIGPHINTSHYEVGHEVFEEIVSHQKQNFPVSEINACFETHTNPQKKFLSLSRLAHLQLTSAVSPEQIHISSHDTYTHPQFHSYRREQKTGLRNISFAVLLSVDPLNTC